MIKNEHRKKYPGWVYRPAPAKKKSTVVEDGGPYKKRAARVAAPRQVHSTDAKREPIVVATRSTHRARPVGTVWDSSWFSGSAYMADPFYSEPLQPLTSVSEPSNLWCSGCSFRLPSLL